MIKFQETKRKKDEYIYIQSISIKCDNRKKSINIDINLIIFVNRKIIAVKFNGYHTLLLHTLELYRPKAPGTKR